MYNDRIISASIVLYNSDIEQLKCVVNSYEPSRNRILYIIDNSPAKSDIEIIIADNRYIYYYFTGENKGYGAGHNIAIKMAMQANTQYHAVLNPDLQFEAEIIDKIADFMDTDDNIAQVMPKIISRDGELQYLCKLIPVPFDLLLKRFLPKRFAEKSSVRYQLKFTDYNKRMNIPYLSGCFMFFRTSAFESAGLFDERFFMYPEDMDITRRMHKLFKTIYYPEVSIIHAHHAESYKSIKMFFIHCINIIKYFNKWGWFFDKERTDINKKVLKELGYIKK
jgi:GT2 family glycosyltransferase